MKKVMVILGKSIKKPVAYLFMFVCSVFLYAFTGSIPETDSLKKKLRVRATIYSEPKNEEVPCPCLSMDSIKQSKNIPLSVPVTSFSFYDVQKKKCYRHLDRYLNSDNWYYPKIPAFDYSISEFPEESLYNEFYEHEFVCDSIQIWENDTIVIPCTDTMTVDIGDLEKRMRWKDVFRENIYSYHMGDFRFYDKHYEAYLWNTSTNKELHGICKIVYNKETYSVGHYYYGRPFHPYAKNNLIRVYRKGKLKQTLIFEYSFFLVVIKQKNHALILMYYHWDDDCIGGKTEYKKYSGKLNMKQIAEYFYASDRMLIYRDITKRIKGEGISKEMLYNSKKNLKKINIPFDPKRSSDY